jgi:hypothetical protein
MKRVIQIAVALALITTIWLVGETQPAGAVEIYPSQYAQDICFVLKHEFDTQNSIYHLVDYRHDYYAPPNPQPQFFHVRCLWGPNPGVWPNLGLLCGEYIVQVWPTTGTPYVNSPVPYRTSSGSISSTCPWH